MADNKHTNLTISQIQLPNGATYDIHDAAAIHDIEELGLSSALVFKGTKATTSELPTEGNKAGDVWYVTADDCEYVWIEGTGNVPGRWEALGNIHDAASSTHIHTVTVTGTNSESEVTGDVTIPTVTATQKYLGIKRGTASKTTDNALGENATFTTSVTPETKHILATATGTSIKTDGEEVIDSVSISSTKSALGTGAEFSVSGGAAQNKKMDVTKVNVVSSISTANAIKVKEQGSVTAGGAASWTATVDANGKLTIGWTANTPTAVKLTTYETSNATVVSDTEQQVAIGTVSDNGQGANITTGITDISVAVSKADTVEAATAITPTHKTVLTSAEIENNPTITLTEDTTNKANGIDLTVGIKSATTTTKTKDVVAALTSFTESTVELDEKSTTSAGYKNITQVTTGTTTAALANGKAKPQTWTQDAGTTGTPTAKT